MLPVDLRSDTVTRPSAAMRQAMASAEVGDDVYGEDPTVVRLQERVADLLGKESALFMPSGVMSNQVALRVLTQPADEVLCPASAHVIHYESGAPGVVSGVQLTPLPDERGQVTVQQIAHATRAGFDWEPRTRLLWLEVTANRAGGAIPDFDQTSAAIDAARERGLRVHLDGARLWNAAVATGRSEAEWAHRFDTVSVCLSKGLGAPVGSVLAGSDDTIRAARRWRKLLGGGMRQVGILAAAGLVALDQRADLARDHARAQALADHARSLGLAVVAPDTNIVLFDTPEPAPQAQARLADAGLLAVPFGPHRLRATFHRDIDDDGLDRSCSVLTRLYG
jgi:threonine aldolase